MLNNKFSKETLWAFSIILVCLIAGCFLVFKMISDSSAEPTMDYVSISFDTENTETDVPDAEIIEPESVATELMETEASETESSITNSTESLPKSSGSSYDCPIDFESLWETNKDVYAWITVPGTVIDYPILQHETDDSYYLNYTIDGIEGYPGCIYTEHVNSKDFTDNNTVIYGHNMRNGTMFTDLHKFRNADFFANHDTVYIYTPEKLLTYKIFAAYLYDDRHLMNSFDFSDMEVYSDYLSEIQTMDSKDENANLRKEIPLTSGDKIITLITCIREQPEMRVYVQAVLQVSK